MAHLLKQINSETLVPLSFITVILGGVVWLTSLWNLTQMNAASIVELRDTVKVESNKTSAKFDQILNEVYYIKGIADGRKPREK